MTNVFIRYWPGHELQIAVGRRVVFGDGLGIFINRRNADGQYCWHRTLVHFRVENLKGGSEG